MDNQNIKSTFSPKSDLVLAEMMKKNNLEGGSVGFLLEKITMFFSRAELSEKEVISSIQKELGVSLKTAGQIAAEIKKILIPTLWNNLSQKEKDSLLHTKKAEEPEKTEDISPQKIAMPSDTKNNFDYKPPKKSMPPVNKKSDGPNKYREPIE